MIVDLERLKRTLADDLKALREGKSVLGVSEMADALEALGPAYVVNAKAIRSSKNDPKGLTVEYALILEKLERPS